jgi:hypothetical protein
MENNNSFTCLMHVEVIMDSPGAGLKRSMDLVPVKGHAHSQITDDRFQTAFRY